MNYGARNIEAGAMRSVIARSNAANAHWRDVDDRQRKNTQRLKEIESKLRKPVDKSELVTIAENGLEESSIGLTWEERAQLEAELSKVEQLVGAFDEAMTRAIKGIQTAKEYEASHERALIEKAAEADLAEVMTKLAPLLEAYVRLQVMRRVDAIKDLAPVIANFESNARELINEQKEILRK